MTLDAFWYFLRIRWIGFSRPILYLPDFRYFPFPVFINIPFDAFYIFCFVVVVFFSLPFVSYSVPEHWAICFLALATAPLAIPLEILHVCCPNVPKETLECIYLCSTTFFANDLMISPMTIASLVLQIENLTKRKAESRIYRCKNGIFFNIAWMAK